MRGVTLSGKLISGTDFSYRMQDNPKTPYERRIITELGSISDESSSLDKDLAFVAAGLFAVEQTKKEKVKKTKISSIDDLRFTIKESTVWNSEEIRLLLQNILSLTLNARPSLSFRKSKNKTCERTTTPSFDLICLFSGGIDSLCGILNSTTLAKSVAGVFVSHDRLESVVERLDESYLNPLGIKTYYFSVKRTGGGIQQLRGFLYLSFAAILGMTSNTYDIVISETGPTMYLPKIFPLDEVTLTTNPSLVKLSKHLFRELYGKDFRFHEPFENLTKAEALASCSRKDAVPQTNSCLYTGFANSPVPHCGMCFGCLVRSVSCLVNGITEPQHAWDVLYKNIGEPVVGRNPNLHVKPSNFNDLFALTKFARDMLEDKLQGHTSFRIQEYGKRDLFERFAMDIFSALYLLYDKEKKGRNEYLKTFYEESKRDGTISGERLENRIAEVREQKFRPDFDHVI